jgi:HAD superfamily hydrolase (TIGR01509 family)
VTELRAVLWDMDGTLIDSEEFHWLSWREALAKEGIVITREQFLSSFGQRNDSIISQWLGPAATAERINHIANAKEELYRDLIRKHGISPLPGVTFWVRTLHTQGWLQAIASAAPRANIDVVLKTLGAAHAFQAIVSAEDVHHGKPDPEVYVLAAARLGVPADKCIVMEDAAEGIAGARSAGMRTIGVGHNAEFLNADVAVRCLDLLQTNAFERLLQDTPDLAIKAVPASTKILPGQTLL